MERTTPTGRQSKPFDPPSFRVKPPFSNPAIEQIVRVLRGDARVILSDGSVKPMIDVQIGDQLK